jgi:16S rRNA (guanine527-N7)-methyltransferase
MESLAVGAAGLGIDLSGAQLDQFEIYYHELVQWNQRSNLTSITGYEEVQLKHFLDSLTIVPAVGGISPDCCLLDVGAGPGCPGLPLKLVYPGIKLTMAEPVGKKAAFLEHMVESLALEETKVIKGRAEALAHEPGLREGFDLVTARGLARMPALLEYTLPFCKIGGEVVALKHGGANLEIEIAGAKRALDLLGGEIVGEYQVVADGLTDNRVVVVVEKIQATPDAYPRRTGVPSKRPL